MINELQFMVIRHYKDTKNQPHVQVFRQKFLHQRALFLKAFRHSQRNC